jgi:hypothetical protein
MECKDIREKLSAYLEGVSSSEEKGLVEKHLLSCPQCRTALANLKRAGELLKDLEEVEPPAWLTPKIMARVKAEEEPKRNLLHKLFFPLHIKIPLEALATVFIAVVAVYVFRAVEPEMKYAPYPAPAAPIITGEETKKPPQESVKETLAPQSKAPLKEHPPAVPLSQLSPSAPLAGPPASKKSEPLAGRQEEERKDQERESIPLATAVRDARGRKKQAAAPMASEPASPKPRFIAFTVNVKDLKIAASEVEKFLGQLAARKIERESTEGKEVLTADLKGQSVEEFSEKLKAVGEIKEKSLSFELPEGNIAIRVEIVSTP